MIKLKLDELSDKFDNIKFLKIENIYLICDNSDIYKTSINFSEKNKFPQKVLYKKNEFKKAMKDFLILRKMMEKNNGK